MVLSCWQEKGWTLRPIPALQVREYIYDMAPVMRAADLVLCRAGASTISELTALGVPALIVPSPMSPTTTRRKTPGCWKRRRRRGGAGEGLLRSGAVPDRLRHPP